MIFAELSSTLDASIINYVKFPCHYFINEHFTYDACIVRDNVVRILRIAIQVHISEIIIRVSRRVRWEHVSAIGPFKFSKRILNRGTYSKAVDKGARILIKANVVTSCSNQTWITYNQDYLFEVYTMFDTMGCNSNSPKRHIRTQSSSHFKRLLSKWKICKKGPSTSPLSRSLCMRSAPIQGCSARFIWDPRNTKRVRTCLCLRSMHHWLCRKDLIRWEMATHTNSLCLCQESLQIEMYRAIIGQPRWELLTDTARSCR